MAAFRFIGQIEAWEWEWEVESFTTPDLWYRCRIFFDTGKGYCSCKDAVCRRKNRTYPITQCCKHIRFIVEWSRRKSE